jgi:hypothetical protein
MSLEDYSEEGRSKKQDKYLYSLEKWGEFMGYGIWLHPIHGYMVMKENSERMNRQRIDTPEEAREFIKTLPPHPTFYEILMRVSGHKKRRY